MRSLFEFFRLLLVFLVRSAWDALAALWRWIRRKR